MTYTTLHSIDREGPEYDHLPALASLQMFYKHCECVFDTRDGKRLIAANHLAPVHRFLLPYLDFDMWTDPYQLCDAADEYRTALHYAHVASGRLDDDLAPKILKAIRSNTSDTEINTVLQMIFYTAWELLGMSFPSFQELEDDIMVKNDPAKLRKKKRKISSIEAQPSCLEFSAELCAMREKFTALENADCNLRSRIVELEKKVLNAHSN